MLLKVIKLHCCVMMGFEVGHFGKKHLLLRFQRNLLEFQKLNIFVNYNTKLGYYSVNIEYICRIIL